MKGSQRNVWQRKLLTYRHTDKVIQRGAPLLEKQPLIVHNVYPETGLIAKKGSTYYSQCQMY